MQEEPAGEGQRGKGRFRSVLRALLSRVDFQITLGITVTAGITVGATVAVPPLLDKRGSSGSPPVSSASAPPPTTGPPPGGPLPPPVGSTNGGSTGGAAPTGGPVAGTDPGAAEQPRVSAVLTASRAGYTGQCPPPDSAIRFSAQVSVFSGPTTVRYHWVRSDGAVTDPAAVTFSGSGRRTVTTSWLPRGTFSGWLELRVLSPAVATSNRVNFSVSCQIGVAATASVTPRSASGDCAAVFTTSGTVSVTDGPATVTYRWISNSNPDGPVETINFTNRGRQTQTVSSVIQPLRAGDFWVAIEILSPVSKESNRAEYTVRC